MSTDCVFGRQRMSRMHALHKMVSLVLGVNVVRRELASLDAKDIANIVDDAVREKVAAAVQARGIGALKEEVWMSESTVVYLKKKALTDVVYINYIAWG